MSERAVQGVIGEVSYKDFTDRSSGEPIKLYSFRLEDSNQWFRTGRNPLPFGKGSTIKFVADGQNVGIKSVAQVSSVVLSVPSQVPTASTSLTASRPVSKDDYWGNKEARDLDKDSRYREVSEPRMALSVATEAAALIVSTAFQTDALSFGAASKAKKLGMIVDATKEVARELALFIHNAPAELKAQKPEATIREEQQESNE